MNDKKHIDRLFQEKLKDFEATPDDAVWDAIHNELHKEDERERRIIPIWWKLGGVAALLALLFTVGIQYLSNETRVNLNNNTVVDTKQQSSDNSTNSSEQNAINSNKLNDTSSDGDNDDNNASKIANEDASSSQDESSEQSNPSLDPKSKNNASNQKLNNRSNSNHTNVANNDRKDSINKSKTSKRSNGAENPVQNNLNTKNNSVIVDASKMDKNGSKSKSNSDKQIFETENLLETSKNNPNSAVTDASEKLNDILAEDKNSDTKEDKSIEDAIADASTDDKTDEKESKLNRWNVSPNVAPVYFNSLGKGSSIDAQFVDNKKDGEVTLSYGVGGSYALNDRLKVRAGINKVDFGYNTNNIIAFRSIDSTSSARGKISNINTDANAQNITYLSTETLNRSATPEIINTKSQGAINQRFGFIEVPLEMEYALVNRKLGVNVIGGFSTLIVDKNEIYSVVDGTQTHIGEANNINNMSYTANFGLGINYNISEKIKVNLEPTFKYQINTFNNSSGDFQPYFIGVYTGLSYKF